MLRSLVVVLLALPLAADEVELKNGSGFSGKIVDETETSITIELEQGGRLTFEKSDVAKVHRGGLGVDPSSKPGKKAGGPEKPPKEGPAPPSGEGSVPPRTDNEQGPLEDLVAKVGPGGVTRKEFEVYKLIYARDHGKRPETPEELREALEPAIVDELVFQAAIADGMLEDEYVRWSVTSVYKSGETVGRTDPREVSEKEAKAYYEAHPEEFTEPAAVFLKGVRLKGLSDDDVRAVVSAIEAGEEPPGGWSDQGWLEESQGTPLAEGDKAQLLALGPGEYAFVEVFGGMRILYVCSKRREERLKKYGEVADRARFLALGEKVKQKESELDAGLAGKDPEGSAEDRLYRAALRAGTHRRPECRPYIVNAYVGKSERKKEELAADLRSRFPVEVLLGK